MPVRQVQAAQAPRRRLREVRRRGDAVEGPARAHGPHRAREPGRAHLVPEVAAVAHRPDGRHDAEGPRARALLRGLRGRRPGHDAARARPAPVQRDVPRGDREVRRRVRRAHGRRGDPRAAEDHRPRDRDRQGPRRDRRHDLRDQDQAPDQAPEAARVVHRVRQQPAVDGADHAAGAAARPAPAGAARRRPVRDLGPERPVPPRHQPQQPPAPAARAERAGHHRAQREAHAAGVGGRAARQRPPRPRDHGHQQAPAEVARRHDQGQAGPLPAEPARQARRLLGTLGHRGRPDAAPAPVRPAEEDGARAVQAVHLPQAPAARARDDDQGRQAPGRARGPGSLGHPRGSHPRAPGAAEPRADAASPRHPGLRAGADRGQGDPAASAGLHRVQRGLRRRPDGRARAAVARGPARGARADAVLEQHPVAGERRPDHRAVAGRRARPLLPDARARRCEGRGHDLHRRARGASRARDARGRPARRGPRAHRRVDQDAPRAS